MPCNLATLLRGLTAAAMGHQPDHPPTPNNHSAVAPGRYHWSTADTALYHLDDADIVPRGWNTAQRGGSQPASPTPDCTTGPPCTLETLELDAMQAVTDGARRARSPKTQGLGCRRSHFTSQIRDRWIASRMDRVREQNYVGI